MSRPPTSTLFPYTTLFRSPSYCQSALEVRFGFLIFALILFHGCKIVQCGRNIGIFRCKVLLPNSESSLVKGLGIRILALRTVDACQVMENGSRAGVLRSQYSLPNGQGALQKVLSFGISGLLTEDPG